MAGKWEAKTAEMYWLQISVHLIPFLTYR